MVSKVGNSPNGSHNPVYEGLFDFECYDDIVDMVSDVLKITKNETHKRLYYEALETGWNVKRAAEQFGVTPHIYNDRMKALYSESDAFVFELIVAHMRKYCHQIDKYVLKVVQKFASLWENPYICVLGDGIGTDSLRFASLGYRTTYFEFKGYTYEIAERRFQRRFLDHRINMIYDVKDIPNNSCQILICREVLEHILDPPTLIDEIWSYLSMGGIAIITESFGRIDPAFPTHLASNRKYAGKNANLFVSKGFRLARSFPGRRPLVFVKTNKSDTTRFLTLYRLSRYFLLRRKLHNIITELLLK